jgi:hypothetical protein
MAKRCLNPCEGSNQRQMKQVVLFVFPCVPKRMTPYLLSTALIPSIFVSVLTSGKWQMGGGQSENTPLECMLKNFKRGCNGDYRVNLTPVNLRTFCWLDQLRRIV